MAKLTNGCDSDSLGGVSGLINGTAWVNTYDSTSYSKTAIDATSTLSNDLDSVKQQAQYNDVRITQAEIQLYDIREQVKEALAIIKHPGLIANRVLDKLDQFIAKHKKDMFDSNNNMVEIIEIKDLEDAISQLREVIKNGVQH